MELLLKQIESADLIMVNKADLASDHPNPNPDPDPEQVLAEHVAPCSVAHVFVNFPEPPHRALGRGAGIGVESTTNALAMLTPSFFRTLHAVLAPG